MSVGVMGMVGADPTTDISYQVRLADVDSLVAPTSLPWPAVNIGQVRAIVLGFPNSETLEIQVPDTLLPVFRTRVLFDLAGSENRVAFVAFADTQSGQVGKVLWVTLQGRTHWTAGFTGNHPYHPPALYPNELAAGIVQP